MRKAGHHDLILSTTTTAPPAAAAPRRPSLAPMLILVLIGIVVVATGVGFLATATGPTHYACLSVSKQGSDVTVTTSGMLHYLPSGYYISCSEGSSLPTGPYQNSCLKISPKTVPAAIGLGASTQYYYISAPGHSITLQGAPAPVNATEYIAPAGLSLSVAC